MSVGRDHIAKHSSGSHMPQPTPPASTPMAFPADFLQLRHTLGDAAPSPALAASLRESGYHIGETLYARFSDWLALRGDSAPDLLTDSVFCALVTEFFQMSGWGTLTISPLSEAVMALDATEWCEARAGGKHCLVSTGLFSGFFGRYAAAPIAAMEVECTTSGHTACRFLLASEDVLRRIHSAMLRGTSYETAASLE